MTSQLFISVNSVQSFSIWKPTWILMYEWCMKITDLTSVTYVSKDSSIKEMLSVIENMFTIFMNKNFYFSFQNGSWMQGRNHQSVEGWEHWSISQLLLSRMWYQTEIQIGLHCSCYRCSSEFTELSSSIWLFCLTSSIISFINF